MDKDDPESGKPQDLFEDESAFEEAPEGAALPQDDADAGEWHEQPVDDLAESGEAYVEEIATPGEEDHLPAEDEFASAGTEGEDLEAAGTEGMEGGEESSARENAEQYLPPEMGPSKPDVMKYLPYVGVGGVLLLLGFFGFQQISNMMETGGETMLVPPPIQTASAPPPAENTPPPSPPPSVAPAPPPPSSPPVGSTASSGEYILNSNAPPPPPLPSSQLAPPATTANVEHIEQQLSALNNRLDDIKRNQERVEEQIRNIQNAPPPPNLPTSDPATQNNLRTLEEKFAQLEQRMGSSPPPSAMAPKAAPEATGAGETDRPAAKPKKKKAAARKKSSTGQWQQPTTAARQQMMPWILRSAQPGTAWLSQGMSSELQRVVPGDKLPGLGTIVSVRMVAGRWLVEGTQGSVR